VSSLWVEVDGDELPRWKRRVCWHHGMVFVPASLADRSEESVFWRASYDGVPIIKEDGHLYCPTVWLAREYPANADICEMIERHVHAIAREEESADGATGP
jgi:hypothetical protein